MIVCGKASFAPLFSSIIRLWVPLQWINTNLPVQVRLQLQNIASSTTGRDLHKYRGSIQTIATIVREEGATAPFKVGPRGWVCVTGKSIHKPSSLHYEAIPTLRIFVQGIVPGSHRQILFTGLRLGLFQRVQDYFSGKFSLPPPVQIFHRYRNIRLQDTQDCL